MPAVIRILTVLTQSNLMEQNATCAKSVEEKVPETTGTSILQARRVRVSDTSGTVVPASSWKHSILTGGGGSCGGSHVL